MYTPPPTLSPNTTISSILTNSAIDMDMDMENEAPSSSSSSSPRHSTHACHKKKAGRRKFKETRHPVYRGVRRRNGDRWVCEVREPNKKSRIWLGTYPTPEMAARAHDAAALALRGTSAIFNFPDSAFLLPLAASSSATDIRTAAAKAAAQVSSNSSHNNNASKSKFQEITGKLMEDCSINRDERNISNSSDHEYSSNNHNYNNTLFLDEEALYNMPALLDSMAEGMLLTPPSMTRALDWDNVPSSHDDVDFTLWTH